MPIPPGTQGNLYRYQPHRRLSRPQPPSLPPSHYQPPGVNPRTISSLSTILLGRNNPFTLSPIALLESLACTEPSPYLHRTWYQNLTTEHAHHLTTISHQAIPEPPPRTKPRAVRAFSPSAPACLRRPWLSPPRSLCPRRGGSILGMILVFEPWHLTTI